MSQEILERRRVAAGIRDVRKAVWRGGSRDADGKADKRGGIQPGMVVLFFVVVYFVVFAYLSLNRHEVYSSSRFDLGNMDQAVWNSAEGRILETTDEFGELGSRLKNHADFLLLVFVPLYWIQPSVAWLLVVQAAVVALGALPLYWLCTRFLDSVAQPRWAAALITVAYLFSFGLQSANLFDFHPQTMAGTLLLFTFYYLLEKRLWPFVVFAVLAALAKEEISLMVAMMGLYAIYPLKRPRWGLPVFAAGTAYFLMVMLFVIPAFNDGDSSRLVAERYEVLGGSFGGLLRTFVSDPLLVLSYALSDGKSYYLFYLFGVGGLLGPLAPFVFAIPMPEVAVNLLSGRPQMSNIHYHYSAPIIPFAYLASAAGLANLIRWSLRLKQRYPDGLLLRRVSREALMAGLPLAFALWILFFNVYMDYLKGPVPWSRFGGVPNPVAMQSLSDRYVENVDQAIALVPKDPNVKVSASNWFGPHLSQRRHLYLFPVIKDADYVVVDLARPSYGTEVNPAKATAVVQRLRNNPDYRQVFSKKNVAVFERVPQDPPTQTN